mmetsp:Transcript_8056/g.13405  ORF Transcript_8056/g.13405 Transcript_8056/m.13405 type:complete len:135 (-) Transcript_8056:195-599(-)
MAFELVIKIKEGSVTRSLDSNRNPHHGTMTGYVWNKTIVALVEDINNKTSVHVPFTAYRKIFHSKVGKVSGTMRMRLTDFLSTLNNDSEVQGLMEMKLKKGRDNSFADCTLFISVYLRPAERRTVDNQTIENSA